MIPIRSHSMGCQLIVAVAFLLGLGGGGNNSRAQQHPGATGDRVYLEIIQRKDKDLRQRGLEQLLKTLKDPHKDAAEQAWALRVFSRLTEIPFDRKPFLPAVTALLGHPGADVRRAAVEAMPAAGGGEADLRSIAQLTDDPSPIVRAAVPASLFGAARGKRADVTSPVVEKLLDDPNADVTLATLHALWGHAVSPVAEQKIIDLSRESMHGGPGALGYDAVYYALSTRPVVRLPVAKRLIELMQDPQLDPNVRWRAAWGLAHSAAPEAVEMMVDALVGELDESLHPYIREYAVQGLAAHRTPAALRKLRELSEKEENPKLRKAAADALK